MAPLLIFLSAFAFYVTGLFPGLGPGESGFWIVRALSPQVFPPGPPALPLMAGRVLSALLPFGAPAYRLNAVAALFAAAATPLLYFSLQRLLTHKDAAWPTEEFSRHRRRDAAALASVFFVLTAPPVRAAAEAWSPGAGMFFLSALGLAALLHRPEGALWKWKIRTGFLGGVLLAVDPRAFWAGWALWILFPWNPFSRSPVRTPEKKPRRGWGKTALETAAVGSVLVAGLALPSFLLALWDSATAAQTGRAFGDFFLRHLEFFQPSRMPVSGPALLQLLWPLSPWALLPGLWGALVMFRQRPNDGQKLIFWALFTWIGPLFWGPRSAGPSALDLLVPLLLCGVGFLDLLDRRPGTLPWIFLFPLLAFLGNPAGESRGRWGPQDHGEDLLTSLPLGAPLITKAPDTLASLAYHQQGLGRRRDVSVGLDSPAADRDVFTESFSPPADRPHQEGLPEGLVVRYAPEGQSSVISPLGYSLGRVPFFFFGPRATDPDQRDRLAQAHLRLGLKFLDSRVMDEAEEELLRGLALSPRDPALQEALGRLCLDTQQGARAAWHFSQSAAGAPSPTEAARALSFQATAELNEGNVLQALDSLQKALTADPNRGEDRERRAELLEKSARPEEAAREWRVLRDGRPEEKKYHWRLTQALLMAQDRTGAFKAAERYLELPLTAEERAEAESFRYKLSRAADAAVTPSTGAVQ